MSSDPIAACGSCTNRLAVDAQGATADGTELVGNVHADIRTVAPRAGSGEPGVDRVIALWRAVELELSPIVGRRATLAMLLRAMSLNRTGFGWLHIPEDIDDPESAIASLRLAFSLRPPEEGAAAADALSMTFGELLSSLVGPALARQLCASPALAGAMWRSNSPQGGESARNGAATPRRDRAWPAQRKRQHRGTDFQRDLRIAEKNRTLFLLDARIAAAREELARAGSHDTPGERRIVSRHEARLVHANERLVLSAIDAHAAADAAATSSQRDLLTGLPNRGLTLDRLEAAIASARRNGRKLGVLFVDLDAFKAVNDTRGHAAGDRALRNAANRLASSVRDSDTVGRFGGDEFLAILPDIEARGDALVVAAKMVTALSAPMGSADDSPSLTASIGIATYPDDASTGFDLIAFADKAMYRAKAHARHHVEGHASTERGRLVDPATDLVVTAHPGRASDPRDSDRHVALAGIGAQGLQTQAEEIHRRQAMFLSMVAHELRNPLNPIRIAADLLQHASGDDGLLARVQVMLRRQVTHLTRLVDDLVDGTRANTGKFRLECGSVSLRDVLDPVIAAIRPAMAERQQTLASQLPQAALTVHADPVRLTQVFANLLDNASKYSTLGGRISLELSGDGHVASLRVTDDGIGITAQALPHIFDLFVQEPHARAHSGQGLGIGLAIVRELVESHGGTIHASSAGLGLGSQFVVTLPMLSGAPGVTAAERPFGG